VLVVRGCHNHSVGCNGSESNVQSVIELDSTKPPPKMPNKQAFNILLSNSAKLHEKYVNQYLFCSAQITSLHGQISYKN